MTKEQTLITLVITTIVNVFLTIYLSKKKILYLYKAQD